MDLHAVDLLPMLSSMPGTAQDGLVGKGLSQVSLQLPSLVSAMDELSLICEFSDSLCDLLGLLVQVDQS